MSERWQRRRRWRKAAGEDAVLLGRPRAPVRSSGPGGWGGSRGSSRWLLRRRVLAPRRPPRHPRTAPGARPLRAGRCSEPEEEEAGCSFGMRAATFPECAPARPQIGLPASPPPLGSHSPSPHYFTLIGSKRWVKVGSEDAAAIETA
ncbi:unnamed protein product [Rangifer tarandus platyrhynchus]|uniref:Uncharacterized protein n=2 Tax=Rangifer tarandus platyrhynchus TaxID=3082113 RepID=A0ABN8ZIP4_RANTA|nr:unnamed protein product [Rangifer tarandus platyrhynchus]CAI9708310.1 unnamed protein product [Rangifer tarandus platyrhynchus]